MTGSHGSHAGLRNRGAGGDELSVQIMGGGAEPERLLLISRPTAGTARVREWTSDSWGLPPAELEMTCSEILAQAERAHRESRLVGRGMHDIRRWLEGASR